MDNIASMIFEAIRQELNTLVEEAVISALGKVEQQLRQYPEKVNIEQASEITGYSRNSLYQMHSRGQIPCAIKIGSKLLFRTKELQEWVERGGPNCDKS